MTTAILITFCVLLLIAYIFDLTSSKTRIPSVILLLLLGWSVRQGAELFEIPFPNFSTALPVLGTMGLILIVLEGSLELELNLSKLALIRKSFLGALIPMFVLAFVLAYAFNYYGHYGFKDSLTNAIPFCIISSAIAIPSVRHLNALNKEFVIYESSFSDILGVLLFNFLALNEVINLHAYENFALQLLITIPVSLIATLGLSYLLSKIDHHIKFVPIILLLILLYNLSKIYHLPGLIFILFFGLFLGNIELLKRYNRIPDFKLDELKVEVHKFKELTVEGAFLIRALFFLLFGFLINSEEVVNLSTLPWAIFIVLLIFGFRYVQLKISKLPLRPLLFVVPRGLITILLFLSIEPEHTIYLVNNALILQVILLSSVLMMLGLMFNKTEEIKET